MDGIVIAINDEWRIRTIPMNFMLERFEMVEPRDKPAYRDWRVQGYYASVKQCLQAIPEHLMLSGEVPDFVALCERLGALADDLGSLIDDMRAAC